MKVRLPQQPSQQEMLKRVQKLQEEMEQTQQALSQVLGRENQRKAMGLSNKVYLFEQISCPAILVECGFLSNGEEASLLQTDGYQKMIAVALAGSYLNELALLQYSGGN